MVSMELCGGEFGLVEEFSSFFIAHFSSQQQVNNMRQSAGFSCSYFVLLCSKLHIKV